jgi:uncharacterized protein YhbP (UPF0306 family)
MSKKLLMDFLKSQRLMSLATHGQKLSVCSVYYAVDSDFNLYFISEPDSEHVQNIIANHQVACSIADSRQKVSDKKVGVQLRGKAQFVKGDERLRVVLAMWNRTNPGLKALINLKNIKKKVIDSYVVKIQPSEIKFFNEHLFGSEGTETYRFS